MAMIDEPTTTELSPRLQQFQAEVNELKVSGGRANPERTWMILGGLVMLAGIVVTLVSWLSTHNTSNSLEIADYNALGNFGIALTVAGTGVFLVMSLRRYLRYWLVRLIYEQRDQTDRLLNR